MLHNNVDKSFDVLLITVRLHHHSAINLQTREFTSFNHRLNDHTSIGIIAAFACKSLNNRLEYTVSEYLLLLLGTALVNNVVLVKFLGLCPFMGVSKKLDSALSMGLATTFVLTLAAMISWMLEHYILMPFHIEFLRILSFILVIAAVVQFTEMVVHKTSPVLYQILGIFLPLITTNCAVLGVALLNVQEKYGFMQSMVFGFGSAVGFTLVMVLFAGLRERLAVMAVPALFAGTPIAFITAGILSLAFMGFAGLYTK